MNAPMPEYVGFWARVGAAIIDSILLAIVLVPVVTLLIGAKIVDAKTLGKPSTGQFIGRYLCYYLSSIFALGFIWVGFDSRKQGWHDKLAGTVVVRSR